MQKIQFRAQKLIPYYYKVIWKVVFLWLFGLTQLVFKKCLIIALVSSVQIVVCSQFNYKFIEFCWDDCIYLQSISKVIVN
jgi:hypothetical protein